MKVSTTQLTIELTGAEEVNDFISMIQHAYVAANDNCLNELPAVQDRLKIYNQHTINKRIAEFTLKILDDLGQ